MTGFLYDHADNSSIIGNAQALRGMRAQFQKEFDTYRAISPSFSRLARQLMERQHWNSSSFRDKTLLDGSAFSRIMNGAEKHWSFETVMAICVGLGVDRQTADKLLEAAGHAFGAERKHRAYSFLLTGFQGKSIDECNAFLESEHISPLGSRQRQVHD